MNEQTDEKDATPDPERLARLKERLLARTDQDGPNGCWIWQGAVAHTYGIMSGGSRAAGRVYVHRVSHEVFIGPIPKGLHIDHLCRVRLCVNPDHLEAVTQKENNARSLGVTAINSQKTSCLNGHPLAGENLRATSNGSRQCLTCVREAAREQWPERMRVMAHVSALVPKGLHAAAKEKAKAEGTSITAVVHQALMDFTQPDRP